jgi:methionyl-tRNA formyltransferase
MKIIALGRTRILYDSIRALKDEGHDILLIVTSKPSPEYDINEKDFEELANRIGCKYQSTENINQDEIRNLISNLSPDVGISVNWKTLIGLDLIKCFRYGIINIHAGDLPKYRGNAVPNWAILQGEKRIALTLHFMDEKLDSGDIIAKEYFTIDDDTKIGDIYDFIYNTAPNLFIKVMNNLQNNIKSISQPIDPKLSLRCYPRLPLDHEINWNKTAKEILRLIKASSEPFSGAYTYIGFAKIIIWDADVEHSDTPFLSMPGQVVERRKNGDILVSTGDDTFVVLKKISFEDKIKKNPSEIIKSIRTRLGMDVTHQIDLINRRLDSLESSLKSKSQDHNL